LWISIPMKRVGAELAAFIYNSFLDRWQTLPARLSSGCSEPR
jgi:hypothetical protein